MVKFITKDEAINIDVELDEKYKLSIENRLELSGLSCANAITKCYPIDRKIIFYCGPRNNGGMGLVCARHLKHYRYETSIFYPRKNETDLYKNLILQCEKLDMPLVSFLDEDIINDQFDLVVDALFGYNFKPPISEFFFPHTEAMRKAKKPVCSIDVPSGWDVENGKPDNGLEPEMLISVPAPKLCARQFTGKYHYLGGSYVPFKLAEEYKLQLPFFPGIDRCISLK